MRAIHNGIGRSFVIVADRMSCSFTGAHVVSFGSPIVSRLRFQVIRRLPGGNRYSQAIGPDFAQHNQ